MHFLLILVIAFTPVFFWLWIAYRWDKYQPEPRWLVIRTFLLGMAVVIPVALIETLLGFAKSTATNVGQASLSSMAYSAFIVAGVTEELGKFLVVYLTIYKNRHFDESTDGIVYASAAALGFASLENLFYMISFGWGVIILRSLMSTFGHLLFSVIWGYPLALRKISRPGATTLLLLGLVGAMLAHGLYDFVLFTQSWFALLVIPILAVLIVVLVLMLRHSRRISTFRNKAAELQLTCPNCAIKLPVNVRFCTRCGASVSGVAGDRPATCDKCGSVVKQNDTYCNSCGNRLVR